MVEVVDKMILCQMRATNIEYDFVNDDIESWWDASNKRPIDGGRMKLLRKRRRRNRQLVVGFSGK
jgi:hypothetical protein